MIRRITDPRRIQKLVDYGARWHKESVMHELPFSRTRCEALLRSAFVSYDYAVWAAYDEDEKPQGVLVGALCAYPFFDATYATDIVFIAHKEGAQLFHAFRQWAKSHGATSLQLGITSGIEGADDFYKAAGLTQVGGHYFARI